MNSHIHEDEDLRNDIGVARIPGEGLAKGLAVTLRHMVHKSVTRQYPDVRPDLPARSRGVIALVEENCTVCMLCARECPDWCIYIDSHKETLPAPEGGRPRARNVLDRFAIDFSLCMYCGICIEACPFDALFWSPEFEYAEYDIRDLLHEKDRLGEWVETVPPPPAHEANAAPPKELAAASRPPREPSARPAKALAERPPAAPSDRPARGRLDVRAIRPPGAPPKRQDAPETPDRPQAAGTSNEPGTGRPARPRLDVRSIRPPGALPKRPGPSDAPEPEPERETGTGTKPETAGPGTTSGSVTPPRRTPRPRLDVRSIRPPGTLPKKPGGPARLDTPPDTPKNPDPAKSPEREHPGATPREPTRAGPADPPARPPDPPPEPSGKTAEPGDPGARPAPPPDRPGDHSASAQPPDPPDSEDMS